MKKIKLTSDNNFNETEILQFVNCIQQFHKVKMLYNLALNIS